MLSLEQIETFYPENLKPFKRNILREYLQYKILEILFGSKFGDKLSFMGGTALHIIHGNSRFSEDLDFDNLGISKKEYAELAQLIQRKLKLLGLYSEIKTIFKNVFRAYIKIPDILFENKLSAHKDDKMLIQLDAEPQNFQYDSKKTLINKFDVFMRINVVPQDILLAQKLTAIFKRKRTMGRDFFDVIFLLGKTKPNLDYLKLYLKIENFTDLKTLILHKCENIDLKQLARDVEPFLFQQGDINKILFFCDYIRDYEF